MIVVSVIIMLESLSVRLKVLCSFLNIGSLHVSSGPLHCRVGLLLSREPVTATKGREVNRQLNFMEWPLKVFVETATVPIHTTKEKEGAKSIDKNDICCPYHL